MMRHAASPRWLLTLCVVPGLLCAGIVPAAAQPPREIAERPTATAGAALAQVLEFGLGLGRYDFADSDETSGYDNQFVHYTRTRPGLDSWRFGVGRQHRLGDSSLDGGVSYTRFVGVTSFVAGIAAGTGDVLGHRYRLDLGVTRPLAGFVASAGYTRIQSKADNSSHGLSLGLTRWLPHLILSAGYRIDFGQPGDTESSGVSLGATYYTWRQTYVGVGVDFGEVSYQLVGASVPLSSAALVDYDAWNLHLTLTRYLNDRSGLNLRYDHGDAKNIWTTDGIAVSYFREW